ncbi:MAG: RlmE family RNA methyltransferase [Alphaproteobacteria bacterium]|nr:RlmE family RNA methyltransferase [Alphaproteobacteria bacterium]MBU0799258.1 RlmE family RNA methyltransferase [Alphaproteobacteria bacterium]MBU0885553.1 RlmE family RNA methyltransferase [Alphaproteobacteria bacterium]MBU1812970.1 RlmE family RNA methyltransferase [Alphaproteobacteria bacterium]MBU2091906.1 RlmE family RNA methyltransferase [Alphaproteobacteria bacterium]
MSRGRGSSGRGGGGNRPVSSRPVGNRAAGSRAGGSSPTGSTPGGASKGARQVAVRVKTARKRTHSSTLWLQRQLNDPYVTEARRQGYRSRAAFKIIQLDEKFDFFRDAKRIVDLGAAPGGWSQVAADRVPGAKIVALDILPMDEISGVEVLLQDFLADEAPERLKAALGGPADLVLSDMAPPTTGHTKTDHLRIIAMCEMALHFAEEVLAPGGTFVCKVFQGGTEGELLNRMKHHFTSVKHAKPPASRADSAELYVVASGFRGAGPAPE